MRIALYARVSTTRQAHAQTIDQQLTRLRSHIEEHGDSVDECAVFRDAGYSGATLNRPGLDQLRDRAGLAEFDRVVVAVAGVWRAHRVGVAVGGSMGIRASLPGSRCQSVQ